MPQQHGRAERQRVHVLCARCKQLRRARHARACDSCVTHSGAVQRGVRASSGRVDGRDDNDARVERSQGRWYRPCVRGGLVWCSVDCACARAVWCRCVRARARVLCVRCVCGPRSAGLIEHRTLCLGLGRCLVERHTPSAAQRAHTQPKPASQERLNAPIGAAARHPIHSRPTRRHSYTGQLCARVRGRARARIFARVADGLRMGYGLASNVKVNARPSA